MSDQVTDVDSSDVRSPMVGKTEASDAERIQHLNDQLDSALADSFPASDPVSIVVEIFDSNLRRFRSG